MSEDTIQKALMASGLDDVGRGALRLSHIKLTDANVTARIEYAQTIFHASRHSGLPDSVAVDHILINGTIGQFQQVIFEKTRTRRVSN